MKAYPSSLRTLAFTGTILFSVSAANGAVVIESFESGTLNGWGAGTLNGSATTVNSVRASDGTFSAGNSFTVPGGFGGWTMNTIMEIDARTLMDENATTLTLDAYSDWANPNGWGVYGNSINLILNTSAGWVSIGPASGSLANGSFQTLSWDLTQPFNPTAETPIMTPIAEVITDPGLSYSTMGIGWFVGTWAGDGGVSEGAVYTDNGTQTFAIDNVSITSIPEPSAVAVLGAMGALALLRRRRF